MGIQGQLELHSKALYQKQETKGCKSKEGWSYSSVVQQLPSMCEALGSIPQHSGKIYQERRKERTKVLG